MNIKRILKFSVMIPLIFVSSSLLTSCLPILIGATMTIQDKWNSNLDILFFSNEWERLYNTRLEYNDIARLYVFSLKENNINKTYLCYEKNSDFEERWDYWITEIEKEQIIEDKYKPSFDIDYQWMWYREKISFVSDAEYVKMGYVSSLLVVYVSYLEQIYVIQVI